MKKRGDLEMGRTGIRQPGVELDDLWSADSKIPYLEADFRGQEGEEVECCHVMKADRLDLTTLRS
jgi:hypothetical protein